MGAHCAMVVPRSRQCSPSAGASPAHGTTEWTRYEVTLTIPPQTQSIRVGAMLTGPGSVWLDDVALEVLPGAP
jgi:hypothetical protein